MKRNLEPVKFLLAASLVSCKPAAMFVFNVKSRDVNKMATVRLANSARILYVSLLLVSSVYAYSLLLQ